MTTGAEAARAVSRGVGALERQQTRGGWWTDWHPAAGGSDEFVTAVAAVRLAGVPGADACAARARQALADRGRFRAALGLEGWGWGVRAAGDADTTAWAVRALGDAAAPQAYAFLARHVRPDGAGTYEDEAAIRSFWDAAYPAGHDLSAWTAAAPSVTAAVAAAVAAADADLAASLREALRRAQDPDGAWRDLWWGQFAHTTALAVDVLRGPADREAVVRAAVWCRDTLDTTDAFGLASRVLVWCRAVQDDPSWTAPVEQAVPALLVLQADDGRWPPSASLTISDASDHEPWHHLGARAPDARWPAVVVPDDAAVMTTVGVLAALSAAARTVGH